MADAREGLLAALGTLVGVPCAATLATNSLMLRFDFLHDAKGRASIWVDPPWRLTLGDTLITGSADWPVWDGVEAEEVNRPLWRAWCALIDPLNATTVTGYAVGARYPDLRLSFGSGHAIETFGHSVAGCWWYYRDRMTGVVFEAGSSGVMRESGESAEPGPPAQDGN